MEEDDTSLWAGKHRYPSKHSSHGGGHGYKDKHHYGHKKKSWYDDGWGYPSHQWYASGSSHSYGHKKHHRCPHGYKKKCRRHRRACRCVRRHHWGSEMNEDFLEMVAYPSASNTNADSTSENEDVDEGTSSDAQLLHPDLSDASSDDTSSDAQFITGYDDDVDPDSIDTINDNEDSSSDEPDPASGDSSSDTDDTPQTEESLFVAMSRGYYHHQHPAAQQQQQQQQLRPSPLRQGLRCRQCLRQQQQQHPAAQQQHISCNSICGGGADTQDITLIM